MLTSFCSRACQLLAVSMGGFAAVLGLLTAAGSQPAPLAERKVEPERLENRNQERREANEQELERLQARGQELEHLETRLQVLERLVAERETVIEELSKQLSAREERIPRPAPPKPDPPTSWGGGSAVAAGPAGPALGVSPASELPESAPPKP